MCRDWDVKDILEGCVAAHGGLPRAAARAPFRANANARCRYSLRVSEQ